MSEHFAEWMFASGYTDLIPVIPPGSQISPMSSIAASMAGKIPGRKNANGTWAGFDWLRYETDADDVKKWAIHDQASFGLRAARFPGVDIDCTDPTLAKIITDFVLEKLGPAPLRVGRPPKALLMYRTDEPFGRMRLWIKTTSGEHLVEVLGVGQQYLVHGLHPSTGLPYQWLSPVPLAADLTLLTREAADSMLDDLATTLDALGLGFCRREADGRVGRIAGDQDALLAPSIERLRQAVAVIPNDNNVFNTRTDYLRMGYAIKASAGDGADLDGLEIFSEWASRWDGGTNEPDVVLADWRRMTGAKSVGWNWISEQARSYGFDAASDDFEVLLPQDPQRERREAPLTAPLYSDQWLADEVAHEQIAKLRYSPERGCYYVWEGGRWKPDAVQLAENLINESLRRIAHKLENQGATGREAKDAQKEAKLLCSAGKASSVAQVLRSNRSIAVSVPTLDHDPLILNTPDGIVDLATGLMLPADPDKLCTKRTAVVPDFTSAHPLWDKFLDETTQGDTELIAYLQRLAGYALTGLTKEQQFTFIWGDGQNGKSVFVNVLQGILGDYAEVATMDTFTASNSDKHSTDVASLHGARLVSASETTIGKRWDEARVKNMTGGEPVKARFMRQDNFTFIPQFKLVFLGNFKPELRAVGPAMERRMHLVPFTNKVKVVDLGLGEKLRAEWPAILAWMIAGCLEWQKQGLNPPALVKATTREYFEGEDSVGDWLKERTEQSATGAETTEALFHSWREWAGGANEHVGSKKRLSSALVARGLPRWQHPTSRVRGFAGLTLIDRDALENL